MTKKRFSYNVNKNTIECDGKFVAYLNCVDGVRIANKLNELANENEQLKQREETLLCEIKDFQELLAKNDSVCHKRVLQLLDNKISFFYKAKADMIKVDDYRYRQIASAIQCLRELRKELQE